MMKEYNSIIDVIFDFDNYNLDSFYYNFYSDKFSIEELIFEIDRNLTNESLKGLLSKSIYSAMLTSHLIELKINHDLNGDLNFQKNMQFLITESMKLNCNIFSGDLSDVDQFKNHIINNEFYEDIKNFIFSYKFDKISFNATNPFFSKKTAYDLVDKIQDKDVLFIPLAHGAILPGVDVYLRTLQYIKSENSDIYPVRLSAHKMGDHEPQLNLVEEEFIFSEINKGKKIVLFNEDVSVLNSSLNCFLGYFRSKNIPRKKIITVYNYKQL